MPTLRVTIGEETHEVDTSNVELPEDFDLISPQNASSKGYFTQAQLDQKVQNRLKREDQKVKSELKNDEDFLREAAESRWGISFDEDGTPKGLKPEVDIDEVRKKAVKSVQDEYESKLKDVSTKAQTYEERLIEQSILSATKGDWKEDYTKYQDDGRIKPIVVNQYKDVYGIDERGQVALRDPDGEGFAVNAKGQHITPDEHLTNPDKFGDYMKDKRQRGSGFQKGGTENGKPVFTEKMIDEMSDAEFEKNEEDIMQALSEGRVKKS